MGSTTVGKDGSQGWCPKLGRMATGMVSGDPSARRALRRRTQFGEAGSVELFLAVAGASQFLAPSLRTLPPSQEFCFSQTSPLCALSFLAGDQVIRGMRLFGIQGHHLLSQEASLLLCPAWDCSLNQGWSTNAQQELSTSTTESGMCV